MMNLFSALELGKNSMMTQQQVFSIIGHNIANVNTEGYSRQVVDLENVRPSVIGFKEGGQGVNLIGIRAIRDDYIDSQIMDRMQYSGKWDTLSSIMSGVESLFDETNGYGFSDSLTNFFNSWNDLANAPTDTATRNSVVSSTETFTDSLNNTFQLLIDEQEINDANIGSTVEQINTISDEIAELNQKIAYSEGTNVPANDLIDTRDRRLRELSELIGVNVYYDQSNNSATVEVAGRPLVSASVVNHLSVVRNSENSNYYDVYIDQYGQPAYNVTTDITTGQIGAYLLARDGEVVSGAGTVAAVNLNVPAANQTTIQFTQAHGLSVGDLVTINGETRSVAGITDDDTIIVNSFTAANTPVIGDTWQERDGYIPEYKNYLNKLATSLVYNINGQHQQGYGLDDATLQYRDFFEETSSTNLGVTLSVNAAGDTITFSGDVSGSLSVGDLITINGETRMITSYDPAGQVASVNIPFSGPVAAGTNFEYVNVQTAATLITLDSAIAADSTLIAASDQPTDDGAGNPLAVGNNNNALAIAGLIDNQSTVDSNNDGVVDYGTFHEYISSLHAEIGNTASTSFYESESNSSMLTYLQNKRDSVSAVSLDEEAANLLQFEKSYQALATFMSTISDLTDVLINIV